jgi:hypothetical protein
MLNMDKLRLAFLSKRRVHCVGDEGAELPREIHLRKLKDDHPAVYLQPPIDHRYSVNE